jgi:cation transport ATPase
MMSVCAICFLLPFTHQKANIDKLMAKTEQGQNHPVAIAILGYKTRLGTGKMGSSFRSWQVGHDKTIVSFACKRKTYIFPRFL